jgi:GNAT superfamily N-acetyltransferase
MEDIIIRYAKLEDAPQILPLMEQLGYPTNEDKLVLRLARYDQNPAYAVAVACRGQQIIGWIAWCKSELFVLDKVRFHVEGLVVDAQFRGRGIGGKLMAFLEDVAKESAPCIIDLTSGKRRAKDKTHEFYHKLGYQNEGEMAKLYLRKQL